MKDKSNFHLSCPKGFLYAGDVNIEYGGTFIENGEAMKELAKAIANKQVFSEWVPYWEIAEASAMDNQWWLTAGNFLVTYDPCMEAEYREGDMAGKFQEITAEMWAVWRWYESQANDQELSKLIQIGHDTTYGSSNPAKPEHIYHAHKKLHNVALAWVKEV